MLLLVLELLTLFFSPAFAVQEAKTQPASELSFLWEDGAPRFVSKIKKEGRKIEFPLPYYPVEIQDTALSEGAKVPLFSDAEEQEVTRLPKRHVFFPFPFFTKVGGKEIEPRILRVYPQLSQRFTFTVERRGDFGLVLGLKYRDAIQATFLDVLDEINRRDLHLTVQKKKENGELVGVGIRNVFDNQNPRKLDLFLRKEFVPDYFFDLRLDNIVGKQGLNLGGNLVYHTEKTEVLLGNVLHKVEPELSFQIAQKEAWGSVKLRAEHIALRRDADFAARGLFIKRLGAQVQVERGGFFLKAGNLRVERVLQDLEEGKVDSRLNFELGQNLFWGSPFFGIGESWSQSGEVGGSLVGFGADTFFRGHIFQDLYFHQVYAFNFRLFSDFLRLSGSEIEAPFQDLRLTFQRQRRLLNDHSFLSKIGFSSAFLEVEWERRRRSRTFFSKPDVRLGFIRDFFLLPFPLPFEFGVEWSGSTNFSPFFQISTRAWL